MDSKEMFEVLQRVKTWQPDMRIDLARRILETLVPRQIPPPPRTMSPEEVFGILKTDGPPPTDEDASRLLKRNV